MPPSQEELSQGHLFRIAVTGRGVHRVTGDPLYYEDDWDGPPFVANVRAFSLNAALKKAVDLPLAEWLRGMESVDELSHLLDMMESKHYDDEDVASLIHLARKVIGD